jgi:glutathione S-transferase
VYEKILLKQKYIAGDVSIQRHYSPTGSDDFLQELTLADLFHLPLGEALVGTLGLREVFDKRPNVSRYVSSVYYPVLNLFTSNIGRWWNEISSRPAWLAVKDGIKT